MNIIKRFLGLIICVAIALGQLGLGAQAATTVSGVRCTTMAKLRNEGNEEINTKWEEYYSHYDEETGSRPKIYETFKNTMPIITFNDDNTVDLDYPACPTLTDDWQCVSYSYSIAGVKGKQRVTIDDTNIDASGDVTTGVRLHVTLPYETVLTNGTVTFTYLIEPVVTQEVASISYENVFDGDSQAHGYDNWNNGVKDRADAILPKETEVNTDKTWTVQIPDEESLGVATGSNEYWMVSAYEVQLDDGDWTTHAVDDVDIEVPAGTKAIGVRYKWKLVSVSNVIQPLNENRVVTQNGEELTKQSSSGTDLYIVNDKSGVKVGYIPTMDMSSLDSSRYGFDGTWSALKENYERITDDTWVDLTFEFREYLNISADDFANIQLVSDMFTLNKDSIKIDGHKVTMRCKWDSAKAKVSVESHGELSNLIYIVDSDGKQVYFSVNDNWNGETLLVSNEGSVSGRGYYKSSNDNTIDFGIYGGFQRDTFAIGAGTENDPPVKKAVTGDKTDKKAAFTFTIESKEGNGPLPVKDGNTVSEVTINWPDETEAEFGQFYFTKAGTYSYSIKETKDDLEGYTYDDTEYTVVYKVTETNGALSSERAFYKNGEAVADGVVAYTYTNSYKAPEEEEHKHHDGGYGNIDLYKVDAQTSKALSGAKIALYKSNGDYVGTYTTDDKGHIEIKNAAYSTYYFQEMQAPDGYILDNTHQNFVLDKDHPDVTIKFTNTQQPVPTVVANENVDTPEVIDTTEATITTGDDSDMALYGMLVLMAGAGLVLWTRKNYVR